jgi:hypothetical protein
VGTSRGKEVIGKLEAGEWAKMLFVALNSTQENG